MSSIIRVKPTLMQLWWNQEQMRVAWEQMQTEFLWLREPEIVSVTRVTDGKGG